jgi:trimeric autotransporter adhesin
MENMKTRWIHGCIAIVSAILMLTSKSFAQKDNVGIGTTQPDNSALLDLNSTKKGLLIPRMTLLQRGEIISPAVGLMVFQTDFLSGFYYYNGEKWQPLSNDSQKSVASTAWETDGNAGLPSSAFIGTVDTVSLAFKINNQPAGLLDFRKGNTFLGYQAAMRANGTYITAVGSGALASTTTGLYNVALGTLAMHYNIVGSANTAVGTASGLGNNGSGNIFLGFQAGANANGNNQLFIDNSGTPTPLIYGNFDTDRVGINTNNPNSTLSIDSRQNGIGGLEFKQLNSASTAVASNGKVLTVDGTGRVILARDSTGGGGATTIGNTDWSRLVNGDIQNINGGSVAINGLKLNGFVPTMAVRPSNMKVLSVDDFGRVILTKDSVGVGTVVGGNGTGTSVGWRIDNNIINNANAQQVKINNGLVVTGGTTANNGLWVNSMVPNASGLFFNQLNSNSPTEASNRKVLSVDSRGFVILVPDLEGGSSQTVASDWNLNSGILEPKNNARIAIGGGITNYPAGFSLFVKGGILSERVRVAVANSDKWADYVFAPNYKLMPLRDVEKFIKVNRHLPNVPSADEMTKNGLDMLETSAKMMEKIEELHLYLIEVNKKMEALENKIKELEK